MFKLFITSVLYFSATFTNAATLMVKVNFSANKHQVVDAWLVEANLPGHFRIKGRSNDIKFDLLDKNKNLISSIYANQPAATYGAHLFATEQEKQQLGNSPSRPLKGTYYLRIPRYQGNMASIKVSSTPDIKSKNKNKILAAKVSKKVTERVAKRVINKEYNLTKVTFK